MPPFFDPHSPVKQLTRSSFNSSGFPKYKGAIIIMFYAPWCPHCHRMKTHWESLAQQSTDVVVAALDCEAYEGVAMQANVSSFPTIRLYVNGKMYAYDGKRDVQSMLQFTKNHASFFEDEPLVEEMTDEAITTVGQRRKPSVVLYYTPWCPHCQKIKSMWPRLGHSIGSVVHVCAYNCHRNPTLAHTMNIRAFPTIVMYKNGVPQPFTGDRSLPNIMNFICNSVGNCPAY